METIASLLGGLGLFLVGIKAVGGNLQQLAGPRLRRVLARATRGPVSTSVIGTLLGGLTQSSSAVTFVATSLSAAGLLSFRAGMLMLAWANVGTAGLVLLASVDLRLAVLWLLGLVGLMTALGLDRRAAARPAIGALLGLGLLFLGLDLARHAAGPLAQMPGVQQAMLMAAEFMPGIFVLATAATALAQSSSTITILVLTLHQAGLLGMEQAVIAVYGASLGSGLAVLVLGGGIAGEARRLPVFQALSKAVGTGVFLLLFIVEQAFGVPLVLAALERLAEDAEHRIGLLFLGLQLVSALLCGPLLGPAERLLIRMCPETAVEAMSRPRFLYDQAVEDAATALDLVEREERRLLARLPRLLDSVREEGVDGPARRDLLAATAAVEAAATRFLAALRARGGERTVLERAVLLESRLSLVAALRETVGEFGETAEAASRDPALAPMLGRMTESLHLLLEQLADLPEGEGADAAMMRAMTEDRGDMMDGLRRRAGHAGVELAPSGQSLLFRATAQFERAVWLIRRLLPATSGAGRPGRAVAAE
jgi:phosphate:Na+ symporter